MADATGWDGLLILAEVLGFNDIWSTFWNTIAYAASIVIVLAIRQDDKLRNMVITICAPVLAVYAGVFLGNPVFMSLQILIGISGAMIWAKTPPPLPKILTLILTAGIYSFLFWVGALKFKVGALSDFLIFAGPLGLACIAFALTTFPKNSGFLLFAIGGAFLTGYALVAEAWVFFGLNAIFALISMRDYMLKTETRTDHKENRWIAQKFDKK